MRVELSVVSGRGTPVTLRLQAKDVGAAFAQATDLGYSVLSVKSRPVAQVGKAGKRLSLVVFVEQLRELIVAGLSIVEALDTLTKESSAQRVMIGSITRALREGKTLSVALGEVGEFPEVLVALVRASEMTSDLPHALARFLEHERRVTEVRDRLTSVAIYPLLLMGVGALVLLFLLIYVLPRFARVFEGMGGDLPWSARAMVAWAHLLHSSGSSWLVGGALLAAGVVAMAFTRRTWRAEISRRLLGMPLVRHRLRTYFLARWYRTTGMLLDGGIPLVPSLQLSNGLLPAALRQGGEAVLQGVRDGLSPSTAHVRGDMATPVAEQLLLAGERAGDLGGVLSRIAQFHETEVARSLERTMRALEPVVMVLIGLAVGVVVVLMYMPIFQLAAAIN